MSEAHERFERKDFHAFFLYIYNKNNNNNNNPHNNNNNNSDTVIFHP